MRPIDRTTVRARTTLIDSLEALRPHLSAIVLVGAQAIYLQIDPSLVQTAPYTKDADLCIKPSMLGLTPSLHECLISAGFELVTGPGKRVSAGMWRRRQAGYPEAYDQVDLLVPTGAAPPGGRRGARLVGEHHKHDSRKVSGLEPALFDCHAMRVNALDPRDDRHIEVAVAGPTALLIAKLHKLAERLEHREVRPDRLIAKDAIDVLRLLRADVDHAAPLQDLYRQELAAPPTQEARAYLLRLFGTPDSPGAELAAAGLQGVENEAVVRQSAAILAQRILHYWPIASFGAPDDD
jgi:hypothetical protein